MNISKYNVATKVLIAQAKQTLRELEAPATEIRRAKLADFGLNADALVAELISATNVLLELDIEQEQAKGIYEHETSEDRAKAEEGFRYKKRLNARIKVYLADHGDDDDLRGRFRVGKLRNANARAVAYELAAVMPQAEMLKEKLGESGVSEAFIAEGQAILIALEKDRKETEASKKARMALTQKVREQELLASRVLAKLVAVDEAIALESPEASRVFRLDLIYAEQMRVKAAGLARQAASLSGLPVLE